ncbi:MAG: hypothetical protein NVSMB52_01330 [Chloroflexota bacterium]
MRQASDGIKVRDTPAIQAAVPLGPRVIGLSLLTFLFTLPHSFEDFVYGVPGRFGLGVLVAGILLSLAFSIQVVGILLVSHQRPSGMVITCGIAFFWFVGAIMDHLHDVLFAWPYRDGVVSKLMEVAVITSMGLLVAVSAVSLFQAHRKFE